MDFNPIRGETCMKEWTLPCQEERSFPCDKEYSVLITHVDDECAVWVMMLNEEPILDIISDAMDCLQTDENFKNLSVNQPVSAVKGDSVVGRRFRALIKNTEPDFRVKFIDCGDELVVSPKDLAPLPPTLLAIQALAMKLNLSVDSTIIPFLGQHLLMKHVKTDRGVVTVRAVLPNTVEIVDQVEEHPSLYLPGTLHGNSSSNLHPQEVISAQFLNELKSKLDFELSVLKEQNRIQMEEFKKILNKNLADMKTVVNALAVASGQAQCFVSKTSVELDNDSNQKKGYSGCIISVQNLDPEKISPDMLFNLFGLYGNVQRVKIIAQDKGRAYIEMADSAQAKEVVRHLNWVKLMGLTLHVKRSSFERLNLSRHELESNTSKDFTKPQVAKLHRYHFIKWDAEKLIPPCKKLVLSNVLTSISDDKIKAEFSKNGFYVQNISNHVCSNEEKKLVFLTFCSVEEAVNALTIMHLKELSDWMMMRISFAKST